MRAVVLLVPLCLSGCAYVKVAGFGPPEPLMVLSPLDGRPIVAEVNSEDLSGAKGENCSLWPISDTYAVSVENGKLCVEAVIHVLNYESGPYPVTTRQVGLAVDGGKPVFLALGVDDRMRKVGQCHVAYRTAGMTAVWRVHLSHCRANELITRQTTSVSLRRKEHGLFASADGAEVARWEFLPHTPGPGGAVGKGDPPARAPPAETRGAGAAQPLTGLTPPPMPPPTPPLGTPPRAAGTVAPKAPTPARPAASVAAPGHAQARALYEQSLPLLGLQRYADAVAAFSRCVQLDATFTEAYVARGNALMGLRRYLEAVADYQYSATLKPSLGAPLYGLAEAYNRLGRAPEARTYYQRYLDSHAPDAATVLKDDARAKLGQLR